MTDTMNKNGLITAIAGKTSLTKAQAREALDAATAIIRHHTSGGGQVAVQGFGRFKTKTRPAHVGRNPQTGEAAEIPETTRMIFRASKVA